MRHFYLYLGIPILVTEDDIFILRRAPGHLTFAVTQVCFRAQRETAWYGNAIRFTRSLWWKCIGDRWIPPTNGQLCEDVMLFFVASLSCKRSELSVVWDAMTLMWHYCNGSWHLTLWHTTYIRHCMRSAGWLYTISKEKPLMMSIYANRITLNMKVLISAKPSKRCWLCIKCKCSIISCN